MFIRYFIFLLSLFLVVPSFASDVSVSTDEPKAEDLGMILQFSPLRDESIDEILVSGDKPLPINLGFSSIMIKQDSAAGLHYFDVLVSYQVPPSGGWSDGNIHLQCPVSRRTYLDNSRGYEDEDGVGRIVDHDVLKEEVLLKGTYKFLPHGEKSKSRTSSYIGSFPMSSEILTDSDFTLLCVVANSSYWNLKLLISNRLNSKRALS